MTMSAETDTVVIEPVPADVERSYVDWPAIIAGVVLATAISLVLIAFGSAVGLSLGNFHGGPAVSGLWIGIAAASWLLWVEVSSLMAGGYLTGRLRRRVRDATEHESDVRDGAHGLLVWGGAIVVGAILTASGIGAAATAIGNVANTAVTGAATATGRTGIDPTAYFADAMFRPAASAPAGAAATPAANAAAPATIASANDAKAEAARILAQGAIAGSISDADKAYLGDLVARSTGLPAADAKTRVDQTLANVEAAKQKAADAAEAARKTGVVAAFLIAASLVVSAAGAYWAAMKGGRHRDDQVVFHEWFRRY